MTACHPAGRLLASSIQGAGQGKAGHGRGSSKGVSGGSEWPGHPSDDPRAISAQSRGMTHRVTFGAKCHGHVNHASSPPSFPPFFCFPGVCPGDKGKAGLVGDRFRKGSEGGREAERAGLLVGGGLSAWFRLSLIFPRTTQTSLGFSETTRKQSLREKIFLYENQPDSSGWG